MRVMPLLMAAGGELVKRLKIDDVIHGRLRLDKHQEARKQRARQYDDWAHSH